MNLERSLFHWFPAFVAGFIWIAARSIIGDLLAPTGISLFVAGILVVIPALFMRFGRGLFCVLMSGFLADATLPSPINHAEFPEIMESFGDPYLFGEISHEALESFGFIAGWMVFAYLALRLARLRFNFSSPLQWLLCAEILNTAIFFFWAVAMGVERWGDPAYWGGFIINLLGSSVFILVAGHWYFDMTLSLYRLCGADLVKDNTPATREGNSIWEIGSR